MRTPYLYCTIDTETVGGAANPTGTYNVGAVIHDREGNILDTLSLLVMELYDEIARDDYAKQNFHLYGEYLESGEISPIDTEAQAVAMLRDFCHMWGVKYIAAYNSGFDFVKTAVAALAGEFEFIDIWLMALQTLTIKKGFAKFCAQNGLRSRSGKTCNTSVQTVYAYLTGNLDFAEEHTALADALVETEIFAACIKRHKHYDKNLHTFDAPKGAIKWPRIPKARA